MASGGAISRNRPSNCVAPSACLVRGTEAPSLTSDASSFSTRRSASARLLTMTESSRSSCAIWLRSVERANALDETAVQKQCSVIGVHQQKSLTDAVEIIENTSTAAVRLEIDVPGMKRPAGEPHVDRLRFPDLPFARRHGLATFDF